MSETTTSPTNDTPQTFSQFLKEASLYLSAHEQVSQNKHYKTIAAGATQYVLLTEMMRMGGRIYELRDEKDMRTKRSIMPLQSLSNALAVHYNHELGYAYPKFSELMHICDMGETTLLRNLPLLLQTGMWAKVAGKGSSRSRYYPLFSEKGMSEFLKVVEGAKQGINPLTGKKASGHKENAPKADTEASQEDIAQAEALSPAPVTVVQESARQETLAGNETQYYSDGTPVPDCEPDDADFPPDDELGSAGVSRPLSLPESRDNSHDDFNNPYYSTPEGASL